MRKLYVIITILTLLSCEPSAVRKGRYAYEKYFKETLLDPRSFKVYSESYEIDTTGVSVHWNVDYGAKNKFGGMVRKDVKFTTVGKTLFVDDEIYDYE